MNTPLFSKQNLRWLGGVTLISYMLAGCAARYSSSPYRDLSSTQVGATGYEHNQGYVSQRGYARQESYDSQRALKGQEGVAYKLPKTLVDYTVRFAIYEIRVGGQPTTTTYTASLDVPQAGNADDPSAKGPISYSRRIAGDDAAAFVVNTNDLAAFSVATKDSAFTLNKQGILLSANGQFEDKSTEIIENFVSSGINVAKTAASMKTGRSGDVKALAAGEREVTKVAVIPVTGTIDCADCLQADGRAVHEVPTGLVKEHARNYWGQEITVPKLTFIFSFPAHKRIRSAELVNAMNATWTVFKPKKQNGVWVRHPSDVPMKITLDGQDIATQNLLMADAGPTTRVPIKSRFATTRNTQVTFDAETGGVTNHTFSGTSQGLAISASAVTITEELRTALPDIRALAATARANQINQDNAADDAKADLDRQILAKQRESEDLDDQLADNKNERDALDEELGELNSSTPPSDMTPEQVTARKEAIEDEAKELNAKKKELVRKQEDADAEVVKLKKKRSRL